MSDQTRESTISAHPAFRQGHDAENLRFMATELESMPYADQNWIAALRLAADNLDSLTLDVKSEGIPVPDAPLPDEIILGSLDKDVRIVVYEGEKDWRVWGETATGGGLYANCLSDQLAYLVAHALNVLLHARRVGPMREGR